MEEAFQKNKTKKIFQHVSTWNFYDVKPECFKEFKCCVFKFFISSTTADKNAACFLKNFYVVLRVLCAFLNFIESIEKVNKQLKAFESEKDMEIVIWSDIWKFYHPKPECMLKKKF